ncbi:MAG: outer membrane protein assembly factor BamB [Gammaproteobacteria bacterium]|jgi:outer membrane protein assembly factor BamB
MIRRLSIVFALLLVGGCSLFRSEEAEPIDPPAPLPEYESRLKLDRLWQVKVGDSSENLLLGLAPATDGARVYAGAHDGRAIAVDLEKGSRVWTTDTNMELSAGPSVGHGLAVFGTSDGQIIALDSSNGELRWISGSVGEVLSAPAISSTSVAVRSVDGRLRVLDISDGVERWNVEQPVPRLTLRGTSAPAISGDTVVAGFDNGRIAAYSLRDGQPRWENVVAPARGRTEVERLADVDSPINIVDQDVYTASFNGRTASLALESGQILWSQDVSSYHGLAADWTAVFVTSAVSHVVAMSRTSGSVIWVQEELHQRGLTAPTPVANSLVVGDFEGYVHWLDATTGELIARARADDTAIVAQPRVAGDVVVVLAESGALAAYRARSPESR